MQKYPTPKLAITAWAEEDRPREKLLRLGRTHLTDAELLAIILGSGNTDETAVDLAKRILSQSANNLIKLGETSLAELRKFKGVGEAKAVTIAACMELGIRRAAQTPIEKPIITSSRDSFRTLYPFVADADVELFYVLYLNRSNRVIDTCFISKGGVHATVVDSRVIFKRAIELTASGLILCHNHPSGNLKPSNEDINLTKKIVQGARLLDMNVLDHLIIAGNQYYSFADEGAI